MHLVADRSAHGRSCDGAARGASRSRRGRGTASRAAPCSSAGRPRRRHRGPGSPIPASARPRQASATGAILAVPMLREGEPIGVITVSRAEAERVHRRSRSQLLETFADQAVIAIENVRLFSELQARTAELTRSVERAHRARRGRPGGQLDARPRDVLTTIVSPRRAARRGATAAPSTSTTRRAEEFQLRATQQPRREDWSSVRAAAPLRRGEGATGRMARHAASPSRSPTSRRGRLREPLRDVLLRTGHRAVLAVPLLREDRPVGGLVVHREHGRRASRPRSSSCSRPSPRSRRWPSRTPGSSGSSRQEPRARGGEPAQVGVPGQHVPRAAHAAQRDHRLQRDARGGGDRTSAQRARSSPTCRRSTRPASTCSR